MALKVWQTVAALHTRLCFVLGEHRETTAAERDMLVFPMEAAAARRRQGQLSTQAGWGEGEPPGGGGGLGGPGGGGGGGGGGRGGGGTGGGGGGGEPPGQGGWRDEGPQGDVLLLTPAPMGPVSLAPGGA